MAYWRRARNGQIMDREVRMTLVAVFAMPVIVCLVAILAAWSR